MLHSPNNVATYNAYVSRGRPQHPPTDVELQVIAAYRTGMTLGELAEKFNRAYGATYEILRKYVPAEERRERHIAAKRKAQAKIKAARPAMSAIQADSDSIIKAFRDGANYGSIAKASGLTLHQVGTIVSGRFNKAERLAISNGNRRRYAQAHPERYGVSMGRSCPMPDEIRARAAAIRAEGIAALAALGGAK